MTTDWNSTDLRSGRITKLYMMPIETKEFESWNVKILVSTVENTELFGWCESRTCFIFVVNSVSSLSEWGTWENSNVFSWTYQFCARMWQTFKNAVNVHQIFVAGLPWALFMRIIVDFIIFLFHCTKSIV